MGKTAKITSSLKSRILLLWFRMNSSLYGPLSTNIIREVCNYFDYRISYRLVMLAYTHVLYFDEGERKMVPLFQLRTPVRTTLGHAYVWVNDSQVLACGPKAKTLLLTPEATIPQSSMHSGRTKHGIISYPALQAVFVFGGSESGVFGLNTRRNGERFDMIRNRWTALPNMSEHRQQFQPCLHQETIVICGGCNSGSCEAFDIPSGKFRLLQFLIAPGPAIVVNAEDYLITYGTDGLVKWRLMGHESHEVELLSAAPGTQGSILTETQPLYSNGSTYFTWNGEFAVIQEVPEPSGRPTPFRNPPRAWYRSS